MGDWGRGASSKKRDAPPRLEWRYKDLTCSHCGRFWMFRFLYDSDLKQVRDERGNVLCAKCRKEARERDMVRQASPPPKSVQMTIDEVMKEVRRK